MMQSQSNASSGSAAWGLGLAACMCNLIILFTPFGLILGVIAIIMATLDRSRGRNASTQAFALAGISFLIAAIWLFTVISVFFIDPTLS